MHEPAMARKTRQEHVARYAAWSVTQLYIIWYKKEAMPQIWLEYTSKWASRQQNTYMSQSKFSGSAESETDDMGVSFTPEDVYWVPPTIGTSTPP